MIKPHLHIRFAGLSISSFHFFGALGFIAGTVLGIVVSIKLGLDPFIVLLLTGVGAGTFFGLAFLAKWIAGQEVIVYYHHEICILALCTLTLFLLNVPILPYLDITLLGIGAFLAFGRIGCFSVGCCHGRPYNHGVKYGQQHVNEGFTWYYKDVPLLPVQLIESLYVFLTVITGVILLFNDVAPGTVLLCYTVIYGLMRFVLEFFRGDPERPLWYGLSEAQWTTLALTVITLGMSMAGWLPLYNWHMWIVMALCLATVVIIAYYRKSERYKLFSPSHVKQIAEGLYKVDKANVATSTFGNRMVTMYATRLGLCVSCGKYVNEQTEIDHYTISTKSDTIIRHGSVRRIATLISLLKKHTGRIDLIDKQNGVYHILFTR